MGYPLLLKNELPTFFVLLDVDNESFFMKFLAAGIACCGLSGAQLPLREPVPLQGRQVCSIPAGKQGAGSAIFPLMGAASWFAERACLPCGPFLRERKSRIWCALLYGTSLPYGTVFLFLAMDHAFWRKRAGGRMVIFIPCGMPWRVLFLERHRGLIKGKRFSRGC